MPGKKKGFPCWEAFGDRAKRQELFLYLDVYTAVAAGLGRSLCHQNRTQAVDSANRNRLVVVDRIDKRDNLVDERLVVTLEEEPQRLLGVRTVNRSDGGGVDQVVAVCSHALGAERLDALVVAVNCLTGVVDDRDAEMCIRDRS